MTMVGGIERRQQRDRRSGAAHFQAWASCLATVVDHLLQPVLLVSATDEGPLQVWFANAAAAHALSEYGPMRLDGDLLRCDDAAAERSLAQAASRARRRGPGHVETVQLELMADEVCMLELHVESIGADAGGPGTCLLLLEVLEWLSPGRAIRSLCRDYALTRAEAQMVLHLHARGSAVELARETGKSVHTVRAQLKAAMHKTGIRTQAGLVALAANSLAARD